MPSSNELITAILSGLGIGGLFAVVALGLSLVFGVMRLINLAHGELIVLGAYLVYCLTQWIGIDPLVEHPHRRAGGGAARLPAAALGPDPGDEQGRRGALAHHLRGVGRPAEPVHPRSTRPTSAR